MDQISTVMVGIVLEGAVSLGGLILICVATQYVYRLWMRRG